MKQIIVVEGPDGAGKTTLAKALAEQLGYLYVHTGPPVSGVTAHAQYSIMLETLRSDEHLWGVVFDRFHLGERVYGPVHRGVDTLGESGQLDIERRMAEMANVSYVMCLPPWPVVLRNWESRRGQEMLKTAEDLFSAYGRYARMSANVFYDYTKMTADDVIAELQG